MPRSWFWKSYKIMMVLFCAKLCCAMLLIINTALFWSSAIWSVLIISNMTCSDHQQYDLFWSSISPIVHNLQKLLLNFSLFICPPDKSRMKWHIFDILVCPCAPIYFWTFWHISCKRRYRWLESKNKTRIRVNKIKIILVCQISQHNCSCHILKVFELECFSNLYLFVLNCI